MMVIDERSSLCYCLSDGEIKAELVEDENGRRWRVHNEEEYAVSLCGHVFHKSCLEELLSSSDSQLTCQVCRRLDWLDHKKYRGHLQRWKREEKERIAKRMDEQEQVLSEQLTIFMLFAVSAVFWAMMSNKEITDV